MVSGDRTGRVSNWCARRQPYAGPSSARARIGCGWRGGAERSCRDAFAAVGGWLTARPAARTLCFRNSRICVQAHSWAVSHSQDGFYPAELAGSTLLGASGCQAFGVAYAARDVTDLPAPGAGIRPHGCPVVRQRERCVGPAMVGCWPRRRIRRGRPQTHTVRMEGRFRGLVADSQASPSTPAGSSLRRAFLGSRRTRHAYNIGPATSVSTRARSIDSMPATILSSLGPWRTIHSPAFLPMKSAARSRSRSQATTRASAI